MSDDLIRRLRGGDQEALREIYEIYKSDLLGVAVCLLVDLAAAEDVLHDVFVGLAAGNGHLGSPRNLHRYLVACVANRARDHLRSSARRSVPIAQTHDVIAASDGPDQTLVARDEAERLYRALERLPYDQREVMILRLRGDMTFREIARHQGISSNTVQSRYRYGIEKLRTLLNTG